MTWCLDSIPASGSKCVDCDKHPAQAVQKYGEALAANPKLVAALNNRCLALLKLKRYEQAEGDASAVLALEPNNVKALLRRANAK